ncbi:MAG: acyl carrier protein [Clostridia bacterium]|nr:acyl carrier protein [Clostridia bacterium]
MQREEIKEKLREILAMTDVDRSLIAGDIEPLRLKEDCGLSSVGMLYTVIGIEEMFGIRFDNVGFDDFRTVGDVIDYIGALTE